MLEVRTQCGAALRETRRPWSELIGEAMKVQVNEKSYNPFILLNKFSFSSLIHRKCLCRVDREYHFVSMKQFALIEFCIENSYHINSLLHFIFYHD